MALNTHHFFSTVLECDQDVLEKVDGNIYLTAYDEELEDNLPLPYIIVAHNGTSNDQGTKDNGVESDVDKDVVTIEMAAENDAELTIIANMVRSVVRNAADAFDDDDVTTFGFRLCDYNFSTGPHMLDDRKKCHWMVFNYNVETENIE